MTVETEKCTDCGYHQPMCKGSSRACIYNFTDMVPEYDHFRCLECTSEMGPVNSNATPSNNDMTPYQEVFAEDIILEN